MSSYTPVTTAFKEIILDLVAQGKYCRVQYFSDINEFLTTRAVLKGIRSEDDAEYLHLGTGDVIRLDRIYRLDDQVNPGYQDYFKASCDI